MSGVSVCLSIARFVAFEFHRTKDGRSLRTTRTEQQYEVDITTKRRILILLGPLLVASTILTVTQVKKKSIQNGHAE
jgi:hypothetical protein